VAVFVVGFGLRSGRAEVVACDAGDDDEHDGCAVEEERVRSAVPLASEGPRALWSSSRAVGWVWSTRGVRSDALPFSMWAALLSGFGSRRVKPR
jgi:hypothetical protein